MRDTTGRCRVVVAHTLGDRRSDPSLASAGESMNWQGLLIRFACLLGLRETQRTPDIGKLELGGVPRFQDHSISLFAFGWMVEYTSGPQGSLGLGIGSGK